VLDAAAAAPPRLSAALALEQAGRRFALRELPLRPGLRLSGQRSGVAEATVPRFFAIDAAADGTRFDLAAPLTLQLDVQRQRTDGTAGRVPITQRFQIAEAAAYLPQRETPRWLEAWSQRAPDLVVLGVALALLTLVLARQRWLAASAARLARFRLAYLLFTLVWIGWIAQGQLTVVTLTALTEALAQGRSLAFVLADPLAVVLWGYTGLTLLIWGRGTFCGWLCPFGALQELSNKIAQRLKLPQWRLPFALHERLWPIKYILFLGIFALFIGNAELALKAAEVEPFKTAIVLHFLRGWPFILYVVALLAAGLFVNRFYCRYLCPLGAALAIPARLRMFEWLKRRWHCGNPCQQCAVSCPVQAIYPTGQISPNECIHCLRCQVNYHDDRLCPPLIERRKRREKRAATAAPAGETP